MVLIASTSMPAGLQHFALCYFLQMTVSISVTLALITPRYGSHRNTSCTIKTLLDLSSSRTFNKPTQTEISAHVYAEAQQ